jgi:hypothetical protein
MHSITFLRPFHPKQRVAKRITREGVVLKTGANIKEFVPVLRTAPVGAVLATIKEMAEASETTIIHGQLTEDGRQHLAAKKYVFRRNHGRTEPVEGGPARYVPAHFEDRPKGSPFISYDLDGPKIPGYDPFNPTPVIEMLRDELGFAGASVLGQVTSSQKLTPEAGESFPRARLRLFFELDQGLSEPERMRLQALAVAKLQAAGIIEPKQLDPKPSLTVQMNYLAVPIVEAGGTDFVPKRLFLLPGGLAHVDPEALRVVAPAPQGSTVGGH